MSQNVDFSLLTEVAGEGGPNLAPQKFLLSQKFRHLMRCKKYLEKGLPVKYFEVSYYQNFFSSLQFIKVKIEGV